MSAQQLISNYVASRNAFRGTTTLAQAFRAAVKS